MVVAGTVLSVIATVANSAEPPDVDRASDAETNTEANAEADKGRTIFTRAGRAIANAPEDVETLLHENQQRRKRRDAVFDWTPLAAFRKQFERFDEATNFKLGMASTNLYQRISSVRPGADRSAVASDLDIYGTLVTTNKNEPAQGQVVFQIEGRWDYGTLGPSVMGVTSLGSLIRTADAMSAYTPTFLPFRNLYWQQGSVEAGWTYRVGKITPDQTLGVSRYLNPFSNFFPSGSVAINQPYADSGLGITAVRYFNKNSYVLGLLSDANADRQNLGDIGEGDFYKAIEFGYKINPQTEQAGYSKITIGHTDGTKDGAPANLNLGPSGWGVSLKWEQELSANGNHVGILKYGRTTNGSGVYKHLASAHYVWQDPPNLPFISPLHNDMLGFGITYAEPNIPGTREETIAEMIYVFPMLPQVDVTLGYQYVHHPALDLGKDSASVFNFRIRTTF